MAALGWRDKAKPAAVRLKARAAQSLLRCRRRPLELARRSLGAGYHDVMKAMDHMDEGVAWRSTMPPLDEYQEGGCWR